MKQQTDKAQIILHLIFLGIMIFSAVWGLCMFSPEKSSNLFFYRTGLFWVRLLWFEAIVAVFWYAFTGSYLKKILAERKQTGAVNIVVGTAIFKLALFSFVVWLIGCLLPTSAGWQGWVWLAQFIVIVVFAFLLFLLPHMRHLQMDGIEPLPEDVKTPDDLASMLLLLETSSDTAENEQKILKKIREKIKYSIPGVGKIRTSENYRALIEDIKKFSALPAEERAMQIASFEESTLRRIVMIQCESKY